MRLGSRDRWLSITALIAGLLTVAFATSADREHRRADLATAELNEARAGVARDHEAARLAAANEETARARIADSRRIAALSESERVDHPDRALILAVEAIRVESTLEARSSLHDALSSRPAVTSLLHHRAEGFATIVAFSPDGKTLAMGCQEKPWGGVVILWSATTRRS